MTTIQEAISRIRTVLKAHNEDSFLTDRDIYFLLLKYAKTLIKREDNQNRLMRMHYLFETLDNVEMIEVDSIEANCVGIKTGCKFMRSKHKLPEFLNGLYGAFFRNVSSIDYSEELFKTEPRVFTNMFNTTSFRYNKKGYYWIINNYLYIPNRSWELVKIEGIFEGNTSKFKCDQEQACQPKYLQNFFIPEYLFSEVEQFVLKELSTTLQITPDTKDDKLNLLR